MRIIYTLLLTCYLVYPTGCFAQLLLKDESIENPDNEPCEVHPVPHPRQLRWQETEFYAFFHYGMNTYTNKEWGFGNEDCKLFAQ